MLNTQALLCRTVNLGNATECAVQFISAGAVLPKASLASNANACSFATARRHAVVGGALVATVADLPKPSVYVSLTSRKSLLHLLGQQQVLLDESHRA